MSNDQKRGFSFNTEIDISTLIMAMAIICQAAVMFHRVTMLEQGQAEMRASIEKFAEKNNEEHSIIGQNLAKTAAILDTHLMETKK
jgi:hypothetical protein